MASSGQVRHRGRRVPPEGAPWGREDERKEGGTAFWEPGVGCVGCRVLVAGEVGHRRTLSICAMRHQNHVNPQGGGEILEDYRAVGQGGEAQGIWVGGGLSDI